VAHDDTSVTTDRPKRQVPISAVVYDMNEIEEFERVNRRVAPPASEDDARRLDLTGSIRQFTATAALTVTASSRTSRNRNHVGH